MTIVEATSGCRTDILSTVARDLEFAVHSLCRSDQVYDVRAKEKVIAVQNLSRAEAWTTTGSVDEETEEAREVVVALRQVFQRMRKGKGR